MPSEIYRSSFLVAPWGLANSAEIINAVHAANDVQSALRFVPYGDRIQLDENRYQLGGNRIDLDRAAKNLLRRQQFAQIASGELVLVTSLPYSEPGAVLEGADPLDQGYFFYDDGVNAGGKRLAIVSTYIWEQLPRRPDLPVLLPEQGRRALKPYLLYAFAMIALGQRWDLAYHEGYGGCPLEYNHYVKDIDNFFYRGGFCDTCEALLRGNKKLAGDLNAIKRLLNVAVGKPAEYEYDVALSFAGRDRPLAEQLASLLRIRGIKVFYDDFYPDVLVGKNLVEFFDEVYRKRSLYCVIFMSRDYATKMWTTHERRSAQDRAMQEQKEYLIPLMVEPVDVPGLLPTTGYLSLEKYSLEQVAEIIIRKIRGDKV